MHNPGTCHYPENREDTGWRATYCYWKLPCVLPSMRGYISWCPQTAGSDSYIELVAPMTNELWSSPTGAMPFSCFVVSRATGHGGIATKIDPSGGARPFSFSVVGVAILMRYSERSEGDLCSSMVSCGTSAALGASGYICLARIIGGVTEEHDVRYGEIARRRFVGVAIRRAGRHQDEADCEQDSDNEYSLQHDAPPFC